MTRKKFSATSTTSSNRTSAPSRRVVGRPTVSGPITLGEEDTAVIMGMRGSGKTTMMQLLASGLPRPTVWDPLGQYPPAIAYRPQRMDRKELGRLAAWLWGNPPATLLVEEAEQVLEQGKDIPPGAKEFFLMGRNVGLRWVCNTRQPQAVTKKVLDEADHLFIFKLSGRALDYMVRYLGRDGRRLRAMRTWVKDPRQGGGAFFWYHDGVLEERSRLRVAGAPAADSAAARQIAPSGDGGNVAERRGT